MKKNMVEMIYKKKEIKELHELNQKQNQGHWRTVQVKKNTIQRILRKKIINIRWKMKSNKENIAKSDIKQKTLINKNLHNITY